MDKLVMKGARKGEVVKLGRPAPSPVLDMVSVKKTL